jgi:hypothetical protein
MVNPARRAFKMRRKNAEKVLTRRRRLIPLIKMTNCQRRRRV